MYIVPLCQYNKANKTDNQVEWFVVRSPFQTIVVCIHV